MTATTATPPSERRRRAARHGPDLVLRGPSTICPMPAYATLSRSPLLWGDRARGVEAVVLTDGRELRAFGAPEIAAGLAGQPFRHGDPVGVLRTLCRNLSYWHVDGPFTDLPGSLDEAAAELERRHQLPPAAPASSRT